MAGSEHLAVQPGQAAPSADIPASTEHTLSLGFFPWDARGTWARHLVDGDSHYRIATQGALTGVKVSLCVSVCLCASVCLCVSLCVSVCLPVSPCVSLCLCVCLSVSLCLCRSALARIGPCQQDKAHRLVCLSLCLSVSLCVSKPGAERILTLRILPSLSPPTFVPLLLFLLCLLFFLFLLLLNKLSSSSSSSSSCSSCSSSSPRSPSEQAGS